MEVPNHAGFALVVVTNQSGIARVHYTEAQYRALTITMEQTLPDGAAVDAVYHCSNHTLGAKAGLTMEWDCQKPARSMIFRAARESNLSLSDSIRVGETPSVIQAARTTGVSNAYIIHPNIGESWPRIKSIDATYEKLKS